MIAGGSAGQSSPHFSLPGGASVLLERRSITIVVGYVGVAIGTDDGRLTGIHGAHVDGQAGVDDTQGFVHIPSERWEGIAAAIAERGFLHASSCEV
jgi:hypothetical protein